MSDPAVEAARRAWRVQTGSGPVGDDNYTIRVRTLAANEALKPIRELHRRDGDYCWSCDHSSWPCATARLIYTSEELAQVRERKGLGL